MIFGILLPWVIVALGCWIGIQLVRQNGRILLRLEALEQKLAQIAAPTASQTAAVPQTGLQTPQGLPLGSLAPDFELPDLAGQRTSLTQLRGQRVLLTFFNPRCGFCTQMAGDLAGLAADRSNGRPLPLIVSTGDPTENRQMVEQYGIRAPVLLQQEMEVASAYLVGGTPMGYLVDEEGRIASELAVGGPSVLALGGGVALAGTELLPAPTRDEPTNRNPDVLRGNRPLSESRLNRSGLSAGTPAPAFRLPRIGGGELSLEQYHGQRVLLVFSDPHCGPCDQLAPQLERLHRERTNLQVLMISRGDLEENRRKIGEYQLTFPVVLQQQWEISRSYGMFATPIAYLVDEDGVLAADVAVGADAILALSKVEPSNPKEFVAQ